MYFPLVLLGIIGATLVEAHTTFDPTKHAGGEAPWFPAEEQYGISSALPTGCTADQAAYIVRHGSRYPEPGSYTGWVTLLAKLQNSTYTAEGPLTFLPAWRPPVDNPDLEPLYLSDTGAGEAFALGVLLRNRYRFTRGGESITVWSAGQQRVVDTASFWLSGYNSAGHFNASSLGRIIALPDSVNYTFANSLTASAACPKYDGADVLASNFRDAFRPAIAKRLNRYLKGLVLTATDIGVMMDLCPYETEIAGSSSFCDIFTEEEWGQFEYAHDLQYYYGSGPGNSLAGTTAFPLIKAITDLFAVGPGRTTPHATFTPPPLLMGFTHDNDITPVVAALGLLNESHYAPLHPTRPNPDRKFRSSYIVPFRGTVALERLSCTEQRAPSQVHHNARAAPPKVPTKTFVRVIVNEAVVPIPRCTSGPGSSCSLNSFVSYVAGRGKVVGDFKQRCGLSNVKNATSVLDFFTNPPV